MERRQLDSVGAKTDVFQNKRSVSSQVGTQNVYGSVTHNTHVCPSPLVVSEDERLQERRSRYHQSLHFDQIEARYTTIKPAHRKTCQWLLTRSEYIAWQQDEKLSEHYGLMWIKGKPATGKSTIMKFAVAHAQQQESGSNLVVLAFFFNARGGILERSTTGMYRSLLFQLLSKSPELLTVFDSFHIGKDEMDSRHWTDTALVDLLTKVVQKLGNRHVICFIDALDECDEEQARETISVFESLSQDANDRGTPFRICLSSRHYPHITISYGISLILEKQREHQRDIKEYLRTELRIGSSETALQVREELLSRASGVFLWVVLVTRMLNREYDRGQMTALRRRLGEIPDRLGALFDEIIAGEGIPGSRFALCIQWVLYARSPLKPEELYFAIISGIEPESLSTWDVDQVNLQDIQRFMLNCSRGLVEQTESEHPTVQFIHESVRDYFLYGNGLHDLRFESESTLTARSHDQLKRCCEVYFSRVSDLDHCAWHMVVFPGGVSVKTWDASEVGKKAPFLRYAVENVFYHSEMAHDRGLRQDKFLENLIVPLWATQYYRADWRDFCLSEANVSLMYVLADQGLSSLIKLVRERGLLTMADFFADTGVCSPLRVAVLKGHQSAVKALLALDSANPVDASAGMPSAAPDFDDASKATSEIFQDRLLFRSLYKPMIGQAACRGYTATVKCMLRSGWTGEDRDKYWALYGASEHGHEILVNFLLESGADVNADKGFCGTALVVASENGHGRIVRILLDAGADINLEAKGEYGTAVGAASARGHDRVLQMLIDAGADINLQAGYHNNSALVFASMYGHDKIVRILLRAGANLNAHTETLCENALQAASMRGYSKIVRLLLAAGVDLHAHSGEVYNSALKAALDHNHREIAQLLRDAAAGVNHIAQESQH